MKELISEALTVVGCFVVLLNLVLFIALFVPTRDKIPSSQTLEAIEREFEQEFNREWSEFNREWDAFRLKDEN